MDRLQTPGATMQLRSVHQVDTRSPFAIQCDVIGALIMRELHTRFGRDNIGYLWLLVEPMMFAGCLSAMHYAIAGHDTTTGGFSPVSFTMVGYGPFLLFRQVIGRAESALEANRSLLYHRAVTLLDVLIARIILETLSVFASLAILLTLASFIGVATLPVNLLDVMAAYGLLAWFAFGLGILVAAGAERSATFGRLVHPAMYFSMPLSGAFVTMNFVPHGVRPLLEWVPLTTIFELFRVGEFENYKDTYVFPMYAIGWCMALTVLGLLALKSARRKLHIL
jgi:capsular polysaccharide transport system permease protein